MDLYREEILEHWQNPQNFGVMRDADLVVNQVNELCGDEVTFYFQFVSHSSSSRRRGSGFSIGSRMTKESSRPFDELRARTIISDVRFVGSGCAISTASASILSEEIKGKRLSEISKLEGRDVLKLIGADGSFPPARLKCAFLSLEAVKKASSKLASRV